MVPRETLHIIITIQLTGFQQYFVKFCYMLIRPQGTFCYPIGRTNFNKRFNKGGESMTSSTLPTPATDNPLRTEESLTHRQATLLDELTARLSCVQSELGENKLTIRDREADCLIKNYVLAGSAMGLAPLPLFDLVALSGAQHDMLKQLCQHYGVDYDAGKIKTTLIAILGGSLPTLALLGLGSATKLALGIGTLGGSAILTLSGGAITYAIGRSFRRHFSAGGTLDDINTTNLKQVFQRELAKGKQLALWRKPAKA